MSKTTKTLTVVGGSNQIKKTFKINQPELKNVFTISSE